MATLYRFSPLPSNALIAVNTVQISVLGGSPAFEWRLLRNGVERSRGGSYKQPPARVLSAANVPLLPAPQSGAIATYVVQIYEAGLLVSSATYRIQEEPEVAGPGSTPTTPTTPEPETPSGAQDGTLSWREAQVIAKAGGYVRAAGWEAGKSLTYTRGIGTTPAVAVLFTEATGVGLTKVVKWRVVPASAFGRLEFTRRDWGVAPAPANSGTQE